MPGKTGLELLEEISVLPEVVFVTAYDEYALRAFEVNALDYLVKPVSPARLAECVKKILMKEEREVSSKAQITTAFAEDDQVFVKRR